jgi:hypothetical protein
MSGMDIYLGVACACFAIAVHTGARAQFWNLCKGWPHGGAPEAWKTPSNRVGVWAMTALGSIVAGAFTFQVLAAAGHVVFGGLAAAAILYLRYFISCRRAIKQFASMAAIQLRAATPDTAA